MTKMTEDTQFKFQLSFDQKIWNLSWHGSFKYRQLSDMTLRKQLRVDFNAVLLFAKYNNARYLQF